MDRPQEAPSGNGLKYLSKNLVLSRNWPYFIPVLIILLFSMVALKSSVELIEKHRNLANLYTNAFHETLKIEYDLKNIRGSLPAESDAQRDTVQTELSLTTERLSQLLQSPSFANNVLVTDDIFEALLDLQFSLQSLAQDINIGDGPQTRGSYDLRTEINALLTELARIHTDFFDPVNLRDSRIIALERYNWLYWSVLIMGFSAFILVLINGFYLLRLKTLNDEKQKALKIQSDRLLAIEAAGEGIGIVDADDNLIYMNKAMKDIHGIPDDKSHEFIGQPWINLYSEKGRQQITDEVLPKLEKQQKWQGTSPIVKYDGTLTHAELSLSRLPDGGMIGTARDISEQLKKEQEKEDLEQQFFQAQKMEAIGRLAGGIAHDFNNILAAINGYAEFLVEDLEDRKDQQNFAEKIRQAGLQARKVVDQMLAFSRQKRGENEVFDVMEQINYSLSLLDSGLSKTIEIKKDFVVNRGLIEGSATQIGQTIMNLAVNALDAIEHDNSDNKVLSFYLNEVKSSDTPFGDHLLKELPSPDEVPHLKIVEDNEKRSFLKLGGMAEDTYYIHIRIEDTGTGISPRILKHIFEPFFTTKPVDKGTGLGLASVHGVITSHRGALYIDTELGRGTRFDLYFPAVKTIRPEDNDMADDTAPETGGGERILVVDDNEDVLQMMTTLLERNGYEPHGCAASMDALQILRDEPDYFDLVITDQNMPKMQGLELVQQISVVNPDLRFIVISGYSLEKMQEIAREHEAIHAILHKPVNQAVMLEKVAAALSRG